MHFYLSLILILIIIHFAPSPESLYTCQQIMFGGRNILRKAEGCSEECVAPRSLPSLLSLAFLAFPVKQLGVVEFPKVLWHINDCQKKKGFCGQRSVRNAVENKVNQISLLQGFPEILSWQNLNHFLNFLIIEFLMGLLIHGTHTEKLSELKTRKSGNLSSSPK